MLTMESVPALPADVRMRVLAMALDPDAPPVPDTLVPADTLDAEPAPQDDALPVALDEPNPYHPADEFTHATPGLLDLDSDADPSDDDHW